jgi:hypothetical protein
MKAKAFKLVLAALLLLLIGSGAAFADGSKRYSHPGHGGYYHQNSADHYRGGGQYHHRPHYYRHPNYYRYHHGGAPVRSYYHYYYGPGYGNCSPGYWGSSSYFSGSYYEPGFGFSFGAIGR